MFSRRRWSARLGTTLEIVLLSLAILGVGGYALYVARFGRPVAHPADGRRPRQRRGRGQWRELAASALAGDATEASPDKGEPPTAAAAC